MTLAYLAFVVLGTLIIGASQLRKELRETKLRLSEAEATLRGVELTVRENRLLGEGAEILGDLVIDKVEQYNIAKLRVELGLPLDK